MKDCDYYECFLVCRDHNNKQMFQLNIFHSHTITAVYMLNRNNDGQHKILKKTAMSTLLANYIKIL